MKKKIISLFALVTLTAALTAACADSGQEGGKKDDKATESTQNTVSEASKIKYTPQDCVTLGDYTALKITVPNSYEVTKEQIDDYAQRMAEYYAQPVYKDTNKKKVAEGDTVNIDYVGKKDGVPFDNGSAQGAYLTIGSNSFIDGFEDGLIGKKVGETVDLNLKFPDPYPNNEELSGADVVFTVTINKIVEEDTTVEVELTDEYVQENLNADSVKEYRENIKSYLESANETSKRQDTIQAVTNKLKEICKVELPEGLLEARSNDQVIQFTNRYCADTTLEEYLKTNFNGMTEEEYRQSVTSEMEANLPIELILEVIADKEGIELEEDKFQEYVNTMMESNNYESEEEYYAANGLNEEEGEAFVRKLYVCNLALEKVMDQADITYGTASGDEES